MIGPLPCYLDNRMRKPLLTIVSLVAVVGLLLVCNNVTAVTGLLGLFLRTLLLTCFCGHLRPLLFSNLVFVLNSLSLSKWLLGPNNILEGASFAGAIGCSKLSETQNQTCLQRCGLMTPKRAKRELPMFCTVRPGALLAHPVPSTILPRKLNGSQHCVDLLHMLLLALI